MITRYLLASLMVGSLGLAVVGCHSDPMNSDADRVEVKKTTVTEPDGDKRTHTEVHEKNY